MAKNTKAIDEALESETAQKDESRADRKKERVKLSAASYEKYDHNSKSTRFGMSTFGKILKGLWNAVIFLPLCALDGIHRLGISISMPKKMRTEYYKAETQKIMDSVNKTKKETAYVANEKMKIITSEKETPKIIQELATLCHETGCDYYIALNNGSALKFSRDEKEVKISYSEPAKKRGSNKVETYLFGTPIGNITYSWQGVLRNGKIKDTNINTVLARIDECGGINKTEDQLKEKAVVTQLNTFAKDRTTTSPKGQEKTGKETSEHPKETTSEEIQTGTEVSTTDDTPIAYDDDVIITPEVKTSSVEEPEKSQVSENIQNPEQPGPQTQNKSKNTQSRSKHNRTYQSKNYRNSNKPKEKSDEIEH